MTTTLILALILCYFLHYIFLSKKRKIEKLKIRKTLKYYFFKNSLDFLVPFNIIATIYLLLTLVISFISTLDNISLQFLLQFEQTMGKVKSVVSIFKLNALQVLVILIFLYLANLLLLSTRSTKIFSLFEKYQAIFRRIYIILVLICSFTFFGTKAGDSTENISLKIKTVREGYSDLCNDLKDVVAEDIAHKVYPKVYNSFPETYIHALDIPINIGYEIDSLVIYYNTVKKRFDINDQVIENLISEYSNRLKGIDRFEINGQEGTRERINYEISAPSNITTKKIKNARNTVTNYNERLKSKTIELINIEGGKKVICQIPKVFTGQIKKAFIQQIINDYPILEPLIDVFFRTLDDQIETKMKEIVDNDMVISIIKQPEITSQLVSDKSSEIIEGIKITNIDLDLVEKSVQIQKGKLSNIKNFRENLFNSVSPTDLNIDINTNLSVDARWKNVPEAQSYRIYWSYNDGDSFSKTNSELTKDASVQLWPDQFPTYYKVTAIKGNWESKPSVTKTIQLYSDNRGTKCQICNGEAIGYCHMRHIYVCNNHNTFTSRGGKGWICP